MPNWSELMAAGRRVVLDCGSVRDTRRSRVFLQPVPVFFGHSSFRRRDLGVGHGCPVGAARGGCWGAPGFASLAPRASGMFCLIDRTGAPKRHRLNLTPHTVGEV